MRGHAGRRRSAYVFPIGASSPPVSVRCCPRTEVRERPLYKAAPCVATLGVWQNLTTVPVRAAALAATADAEVATVRHGPPARAVTDAAVVTDSHSGDRRMRSLHRSVDQRGGWAPSERATPPDGCFFYQMAPYDAWPCHGAKGRDPLL